MKRINLEEFDGKSVDVSMNIPEESLRDLICITEESIQSLSGQMNEMTENVKKMTEILSINLPSLVTKITDLMVAMEEHTKDGLKKTDELIKALERSNG
jgi:hypothetical protein